jgi:adenylate cyclase
MALKDDLTNKVTEYFRAPYEVKGTTVVPDYTDPKLTFGNTGLEAELVFMFADIRESSKLHDRYGWTVAARIYQSFHDICVKVIAANEGKVRAFDGDRIMGVFAGPNKENNAVKAAMQIQNGVRTILNPTLQPRQAVMVGFGIDGGKTLITKVGAGRDVNNNDLVWIGKACNYASHYAQEANNTIILSDAVHRKLQEDRKTSNGVNMWTPRELTVKNGAKVACYSTGYSWGI